MALRRALPQRSYNMNGLIEFLLTEPGLSHESVQVPHQALKNRFRSSIRRTSHFLNHSIRDLLFAFYNHTYSLPVERHHVWHETLPLSAIGMRITLTARPAG